MTCKQIHYALVMKVRQIGSAVKDKSDIPTYSPNALAREIYETRALCDELLNELKNMDVWGDSVQHTLNDLEKVAA